MVLQFEFGKLDIAASSRSREEVNVPHFLRAERAEPGCTVVSNFKLRHDQRA
jgi:hypothetical protein